MNPVHVCVCVCSRAEHIVPVRAVLIHTNAHIAKATAKDKEIHTMVPEDADLKTFVDNWSDNVSDAQGLCTNLAAKWL